MDTRNGTKPLEDRIEVIKNFQKPKTIQELHRFLGIINYYRRFIKEAAHTQAPLHQYLVGAKKKDKREIIWIPEANKAFEASKQQLMGACSLAHPHDNAVLALYSDASDSCMGAVLEQLVDGDWQPLGFYSKKLSDTQRKYSTYDRELLAMYSGLKYFKHLVEGQQIVIETDHKPLTYAFRQKSDEASPRQLRQLDYIAQFTTAIVHVSAENNIVADALSRLQAIDSPTIVSTDELAKAQEDDVEL